jgi:hypothetical protein
METIKIRDFILSRGSLDEALSALTEIELATEDQGVFAYCEEIREYLANFPTANKGYELSDHALKRRVLYHGHEQERSNGNHGEN